MFTPADTVGFAPADCNIILDKLSTIALSEIIAIVQHFVPRMSLAGGKACPAWG